MDFIKKAKTARKKAVTVGQAAKFFVLARFGRCKHGWFRAVLTAARWPLGDKAEHANCWLISMFFI